MHATVRALLMLLLQAAQEVFAGKATVQLQGSVSKGTSTVFSADVDTFVRHMGVVDKEQRMDFARTVLWHFERNSIKCKGELRRKTIRFYEVSVDG